MSLSLSHSYKSAFVLLLLLTSLLAIFSVQAQESTAPEPTSTESPALSELPLATEAPDALPLATSEPSLPTDIPPTQETLPTQEVLPTEDVSPVPTQETLPTATEDSTATQDTTPDLLPLAYSTNFDAGYPQELSASTGWTVVDLEAGKALQPDAGALAIHYASFFADSAVQARFFLVMGEGQVILRGYKAGLYASGLLTLYHGETVVTTANIDMTGKTWPLLRLQIIGTQVQVSVDGTALITAADNNLQAGQAGFAAREGSSLRVDDFAVYGLPVAAPAATSTSTATPPPTATSTRPAPMAGLTATCAPSARITLIAESGNAQPGSLSPDGTMLVYNVAGKIYLFDRPNCTITELTDATADPNDPAAYQLTADKRTLFYKGTSLHRYNIALGTQEAIALDASNTPQPVSQFDVTPDGRYVVYGTYAPMLASDTNGLYDVYLRDLTTGVTEQISVDGNENPLTPSSLAGVTVGLSNNGRYVLFDSDATLPGYPGTANNNCETDGLDNDANENCFDLFLRDRAMSITYPVSVSLTASTLPLGIDRSPWPDGVIRSKAAISGDGNYVFFGTLTPLVALDTDTAYDVYRYDLQGESSTRIALVSANGSNGNSASPAFLSPLGVNDNGSIALFSTQGAMTGRSDPNINGSIWQLWARNMSSQTSFLVSRTYFDLNSTTSTTYGQAGSASTSGWNAAISADGTTASFASSATNLTSDALACEPNCWGLYHAPLLDRTRAQTPTNLRGSVANGILTLMWDSSNSANNTAIEIRTPDIYTSTVTVSGTLNTYTLTNVGCGMTYWFRVRARVTGEYSTQYYSPWSEWIAIRSAPCVPACQPMADFQRVNVGTLNQYQTGEDLGAVYGMTDRYVFFSAYGVFGDENEVALEQGPETDVYRFDRETCTTEKVSVGDDESETLESAYAGDFSANGSLAAFRTASRGLVSGDGLNDSDVFIRDMNAGTTRQLVPTLNGVTLSGPMDVVSLTDDGRYALIVASDPLPGYIDTNGIVDHLVVDTQTNEATLVTINMSGTGTANGTAAGLASNVSGDLFQSGGKVYAVFYSTASNLVPNDTNIDTNTADDMASDVFLRNVTDGITTRLSLKDDESQFELSSFFSEAALNGTTLIVPFVNAYPNTLYVRTVDLANPAVGTTAVVSQASGTGNPAQGTEPSYGTQHISADGRFVSFLSASAVLVPGDTNAFRDLFVRDLWNNLTIRMMIPKTNGTMISLPNNASFSPDGTWMLFSYYAEGISTAATNYCRASTSKCLDTYAVRNPLMTALPAPSNVMASTDQSDTVTITWHDSPAEQGYWLEHSANNGVTWTTIVLPDDTTSYDLPVACAETRIIRLRQYAHSPVYAVSVPAAVTGATIDCLPNTPDPLTASTTYINMIRFTWGNVVGEAGYLLERSSDRGETWTTFATVGANITQYDLTGLLCGQSWWVRARSFVNVPSYQVSDATAAVTASTRPCATATPTRTPFSPVTMTPSATMAVPTWTRTSTATRTPTVPATSTGTVTATDTATATASKTLTPTSTGTITATFTPSRTPTATRTLAPSKTPTLTATRTPAPPTITLTSTPTKTATATSTGTITATFEPLVAPTNVQVSLSGTTLNLTWVDTNSNETAYEIETTTAPGVGSKQTVAANATLYSTTWGCGATIWLRVRVVRGSEYGAYSQWVSITTAPCTASCPSTANTQRVNVGAMHQYYASGTMMSKLIANRVSGNGRYSLFSSTSPITDTVQEIGLEGMFIADLYRHDRQTCTTVKISVGANNTETRLPVTDGVITSDGNRVFFITSEEGLVAEPYSGASLFVRDVTLGATTRLPLNAQGMSVVDASADGRYVLLDLAAETPFTGLPDTNNGTDVLVYDTQLNALTPVSVNTTSTQMASTNSTGANVFTANGKVYVVFSASGISNIMPSDVNSDYDTYLRSVTDSKTAYLTLRDNEVQIPKGTRFVGMGTSGNEIAAAFITSDYGTSGVNIDTLIVRQVPLDNPGVGTTKPVALQYGQIMGNVVTRATISENGRYVMFVFGLSQPSTIYTRDLFKSTLANFSANVNSNEYFSTYGLSADGSYIYGYTQASTTDAYNFYAVKNTLYTSVAAPATATPTLPPTSTPTMTKVPTLESTLEATLEPTLDPVLTITSTVTNTPTRTPTLTATPVPPPANPTNLQVALSGTDITLNWQDNSDEYRFEIERSGGYIRNVATNVTSFTDSNLPCGLIVWYRVRAYRMDGKYSEWTPWVSISTAPCAQTCDPTAAVQRVSTGSGSVYQRNQGILTSVDAPTFTGQYVLFQSASPLADDPAEIASEWPQTVDLYRYDTLTCTTVKVSVGDDENETLAPVSSGFLSSDGNLVAFNTLSRGIAPGDDLSNSSMYVRDIAAGTTRQLSPLWDNTPVEGASIFSITPDGRYALIQIDRPLWADFDANNASDLAIYDLTNGALTMVTMDTANTATGNGSSTPRQLFVANGQLYVLFVSSASNLVTGDTNTYADVFLRNVTTGTTTLLSRMTNNSQFTQAANMQPHSASVVDGTLLAVLTRGGNSYLRTVSLAAPTVGTTGDLGTITSSMISADGQWIVYESTYEPVAPGNNVLDVYVQGVGPAGARNGRVSLTAQGAALTAASYARGISPDGSRLLIETTASGLDASDTNTLCGPNGNQNCSDLFLIANPLFNRPPTPTDVAAVNTGSTLNVSWTPVSGVSGYLVEYRGGASSPWIGHTVNNANASTYSLSLSSCLSNVFVRVSSYVNAPMFNNVSLPSAEQGFSNPACDPTSTGTLTPTFTATTVPSSTPTATLTPSVTSTPTLTRTPTLTSTSTPSQTPTVTGTLPATQTPTQTQTPAPIVAPSNVQVTRSGTTNTITWIDTNNAENFYYVQRLPARSSDVAVSEQNLPYHDEFDACGITVFYRVHAYKSDSTPYAADRYSEWVSVNTPPCNPVPVPCPTSGLMHVSVGPDAKYQTYRTDRGTDNQGLSNDGRYVLFSSLMPLDDNRDAEIALEIGQAVDLYRFDTQTCTSVKVSVGDSENESTLAAVYGTLSDDGNLAVFASASPGLTTDPYTGQHVFVRDIAAQTTERIPFPDAVAEGEILTPRDITPDGRYVLFDVIFSNVQGTYARTYVYDRLNDTYLLTQTGTTYGTHSITIFAHSGGLYIMQYQNNELSLLDVNSGLRTSIGGYLRGGLSFNGDWLTFTTTYGTDTKVYLRSINVITREKVSSSPIVNRLTGSSGTILNNSFMPVLSSNGRWVMFTNRASDQRTESVYVRDLQTFETVVVPGTMRTSLSSRGLAFSADGKHIVFTTAIGDLVPSDANNWCETDTTPDYNDSCDDLFITDNPLYSDATVPPTVTPSPTPTLTPTATPTLTPMYSPTATLSPTPVNFLPAPSQVQLKFLEGIGAGGVSGPVLSTNTPPAFPGFPTATSTPPTHFSVIALVTWQDNSADETLFQVERIVNGSSVITTISPNNISFNEPLSCGVTRSYRVRAYRTSDNVYSDWSPWVSGTAPACYTPVPPTLTPSLTPTLTPSATATAIPLPIPTLVSPAQNTLMTERWPDLIWKIVPGISRFHLQVSKTADFTALAYESQQMGGYLPGDGTVVGGTGGSLPQGEYWWRVRSRADSGQFSEWSEVRRFEVNIAEKPADGAVAIVAYGTSIADIQFSWAGQRYYDESFMLQVATDASFTTIAHACPATTALTCNLTLPVGSFYWRVVIVRGAALNVPLHPFALTISQGVPAVPVPVTPLNGEAIGSQTPTLSWGWKTMPADTTGYTYEVEVDKTATFNSEALGILADLTETSVVWPPLSNGLYFWRVRALNAFGLPGPWSTVSRFIVDSVAPDAPTLLLPTENMLYNTPRPTFKWTAVPGATAYHVYIAPPNGMCDSENTTAYWVGEYVTTTFYTMPAPMPQDTFQVCVRALDAALNFSPLSEFRTFRIFLGTQPLEGAFISAAVRPTFRWTPAPVPLGSNITIKYRVEIDNDSDPTNALWHASPALAVAVTTYTPPDLLPPGVYRWRVVRVGSSYDENLRVPEWRTLIIGALTTGPELMEPTTSQLINSPVLLRWNEASAPVETAIDSYEVMISRSSLFAASVTTRVIETGLSSAFTPAASMNRVTHYWRVRGLWNGMPVTNWSTRSFIVDTVAPAAPVISAPLSNMLVGTVRPAITWKVVPGATQYTVGIADAATNEDLMDETTVTTLSYVPTVNLPQTAVIVRVRASDGINDGAWASVTFNVRLGTAPIQNAVVITNRPTFTWAAVPGAEGYTLQIDNDPFFDTNEPGGDATIFRSISLGPVTAYTLSDAQKLSAQGTYYWRLMPSNGGYPQGTASRAFYWSAAAALKPGGLASEEAAEPDETALPSVIFNPSVSLISLRWNGITPPPVKYEIQIGTSGVFAAVGVVQRFSLEPSLLVDPMQLSEGLKHWRVRGVYSADGTSFGPWSDAGTFTIDRTPPAPPMIIGGLTSTVSTVRPAFKWVASIGAFTYRLSVVDAGTGVPVPGLDGVMVKTTSYIAPTALNQNTASGYRWSVQAVDAAGNISGTGLQPKIYVFSGTSPKTNQLLTTLRPAFQWTAVAGTGSARWTLEIARDAQMTDKVYSSPTPMAATATTFTLPVANALTPGLYYWRVYRLTEDSATIQGQPFWVGDLKSITPQLLTPASNSWLNADQLAAGAMFTWSAQVTGSAASPISPLSYRFELAKAATFTPASIVYTQDVSGAAGLALPQLTLADGTYYWRVRAQYAANMVGPYSVPYSVRFDKTRPTMPVLLAPVSRSIITHTRTPLLTWSAAAGSTSYVIEVATDANFTNIRATKTVSSLTLSFITPSLPNGPYYWRVLAKDAAGNITATSGRRFTVAAP